MKRSDELLAELLDRLSRGDSEAAGQIFVAYMPYLRKVIRRQLPAQLRRKLDSSDVLQSAWGDVLEGLGKANWTFETPDAASSSTATGSSTAWAGPPNAQSRATTKSARRSGWPTR